MKIQVSFEELYMQASRLESISQEYAGQIAMIQNKMQETAAHWQGEDAAAFLAQANSLQPRLQQMKETMDAYAHLVKNSAQAYESLMHARTASARSLGV